MQKMNMICIKMELDQLKCPIRKKKKRGLIFEEKCIATVSFRFIGDGRARFYLAEHLDGHLGLEVNINAMEYQNLIY